MLLAAGGVQVLRSLASPMSLHNLIISNPREVLEQIEAFVSTLAERR